MNSADHARQHGAGDHVDPLVAQVLHGQALVHGVGLDEREAPRRQRRADGGDGVEDPLACAREVGDDKALGGGAPVRVGQDAGDDVGDEDGAQRQQHVLDAAEGAAQDEQADRGGGERDRQIAAGAGKDLHPGGDAGELGADRAEVGHHQRGQRSLGPPPAVALVHESHQTLAGDDAGSGGEIVEDDQGDRRQGQDPQEPVAVVGAEDRIGRDPGGVVVGQPGQQSRPEYGQQGQHARHDDPAIGFERPLRPARNKMRTWTLVRGGHCPTPPAARISASKNGFRLGIHEVAVVPAQHVAAAHGSLLIDPQADLGALGRDIPGGDDQRTSGHRPPTRP